MWRQTISSSLNLWFPKLWKKRIRIPSSGLHPLVPVAVMTIREMKTEAMCITGPYGMECYLLPTIGITSSGSARSLVSSLSLVPRRWTPLPERKTGIFSPMSWKATRKTALPTANCCTIWQKISVIPRISTACSMWPRFYRQMPSNMAWSTGGETEDAAWALCIGS